MQLEDIERLEGLAKAVEAAEDALWNCTSRPDFSLAVVRTCKADLWRAKDVLDGALWRRRDALLALAREALERRRDEAPAKETCRDCDDTGEFYGNLNIACGCPAGADFKPRAEADDAL